MAWTRETVMAQENRGGARPGAGRKPGPNRTLSAKLVNEMLRKAKKYARKHGKTLDEVLLDLVYAETTRDADKIACVRLFKEYTTPKIEEGGEVDRQLGPAVFLPEHRPPLKVVEKAA